jgi:flagellar biogenesis protein FliO
LGGEQLRFFLGRSVKKSASSKAVHLLLLSLLAVTIFNPHLLNAQDTSEAENISSESPESVSTESSENMPSKSPDDSSGEISGQTADPGNVPAEPDYEYEDPEFGENRISYPLLVLRALAILAVIIIGMFFLFRLLMKKRNRIVTDTGIIKVLATYPLASNRLIQVVEIAGKIMILGVTESNINLITEVEDGELIDKIKLLSSKESTGGGSFKDQFLKLIGGKSFQNSGQLSYFSNYKKRINKIKKL